MKANKQWCPAQSDMTIPSGQMTRDIKTIQLLRTLKTFCDDKNEENGARPDLAKIIDTLFYQRLIGQKHSEKTISKFLIDTRF